MHCMHVSICPNMRWTSFISVITRRMDPLTSFISDEKDDMAKVTEGGVGGWAEASATVVPILWAPLRRTKGPLARTRNSSTCIIITQVT